MATKKKTMSGASEIPLIFSIDGSARHELFIISTAASLSDLISEIESLTASSPNCKEFMSKYKKAGEEKVAELKMKWGVAGRESKIWPATTILTEENTEAVLMMVERGGGLGRDVLEVKMKTEEEK
jgi:hypothetical protein